MPTRAFLSLLCLACLSCLVPAQDGADAFDARFTGPVGDQLQTRPSHDPQSSAISSAYTSAFNAYLRDELGYDGEREYVPSGATRNVLHVASSATGAPRSWRPP